MFIKLRVWRAYLAYENTLACIIGFEELPKFPHTIGSTGPKVFHERLQHAAAVVPPLLIELIFTSAEVFPVLHTPHQAASQLHAGIFSGQGCAC